MNKDFFVLGLDISTKTIGVTILNNNGGLEEIFPIILPKSSKKNGTIDIYDKVLYFSDIIKEAKLKYNNIQYIYIEEPLKNSINVNTAMLLAKFNGMVSQEILNIFNIKPIHKTIYELRSEFFPEYVKLKKKKGEIVKTLSLPPNVDKKKLVLEKVHNISPWIEWMRDKNLLLKEENYDMADSYVVAWSGMKIDGII